MQDRFDADGDVTAVSMRRGVLKVAVVYLVSGVVANIVSCVGEPPRSAGAPPVLSVGAWLSDISIPDTNAINHSWQRRGE
jgi:hypothetical protein